MAYLACYGLIAYNFSRDLRNQQLIIEAYTQYFKRNEKIPQSLGELVDQKLLPVYSSFYREPPEIFGQTHYSSSDYFFAHGVSDSEGSPTLIGRRKAGGEVEFLPVTNSILRENLRQIQTGTLPPGKPDKVLPDTNTPLIQR